MGFWGIAGLCYFVISRLAYVIGVGTMLTLQDRRQYFTRRWGLEEGFRRFRRNAAFVMYNDGVAIVVACILTADTIDLGISPWVRIPIALFLGFIGIGTKVWAARSLGIEAYYWHNFFAPDKLVLPDPPGPYRYLDNPMYTVGYLHCYGMALLVSSKWGFFVCLFAQAAIMVFHAVVERPHFERLVAGR